MGQVYCIEERTVDCGLFISGHCEVKKIWNWYCGCEWSCSCFCLWLL